MGNLHLRILTTSVVLLATAVVLRAQPGQSSKADDSLGLTRAFTALYSGDADRALHIATTFLKQHPNDIGALVLAARAHLAREENGAAYELLRKALQVDSRNADVLYFLGITAASLAAREFDRLYALSPDHPRVHQLMARSLKLQGKQAEAGAEYALVLQKEPDLLEALLELAAIRREESNCEAAIALYERADRLSSSYDSAYGLGACLAAMNEAARASQAFEKALAYDPQSAVAHFGLGSSLLQSGKVSAAARELERATALEPKMRQAYYLLGRAYAAMNMPEPSRQAFARAEELAKAERAADEKALRGAPPGPPKRQR